MIFRARYNPASILITGAAGGIGSALARGRARIHFHLPINVAVFLMSLLPPAWVDRLAALK